MVKYYHIYLITKRIILYVDYIKYNVRSSRLDIKLHRNAAEKKTELSFAIQI